MKKTNIHPIFKSYHESLGKTLQRGKLTDKQQNFIHGVANGMSMIEAYRASYSTQASDKVVSVSASKLLKQAKVKQALEKNLAAKAREDKIPQHKPQDLEQYVIRELMKLSESTKDLNARIRILETLGQMARH